MIAERVRAGLRRVKDERKRLGRRRIALELEKQIQTALNERKFTVKACAALPSALASIPAGAADQPPFRRRGRVRPRAGQMRLGPLAHCRLLDLHNSYSAGAGGSITATVSTALATAGAAFFAAARVGLALATGRLVDFPAAFLALGRPVAPFPFWTFDDCFLRLAIVDLPVLIDATQTR
jgi:hypothetical protein